MTNDHDSFDFALNLVSEFRFSFHLTLFNHYTYNSYVRLRPIDFYPITGTLTYEFYDDLYMALTVGSKITVGTVSSWIY